MKWKYLKRVNRKEYHKNIITIRDLQRGNMSDSEEASSDHEGEEDSAVKIAQLEQELRLKET